MRKPRFGKKFSVQEIEREVTEQIESMVRSGKNPPPASWTLLGGLPVEEGTANATPPAPATAEVQAEAAQVESEAAQVEAEAADEPQTAAPPPKPRAKSPAKPRAKAAKAAKATRARSSPSGSGSASTRSRRSSS